MRKTIELLFLSVPLLLLIFSAANASEETQGHDDDKNAVKILSEKVLSFFEPSLGEVTGVEPGLVRLKVKSDGRISEGARLSVFRQGDSFYHPTTKELIGSSEDLVGLVEIIEAGEAEGVYTGSLVKGDIEKGDIVRITSSKIRVAFFQEREADWSLSEAFYSSIKESGRFDIFEKYTSTTEREELLRLSGELGADVLLFLATPVEDDKKLLNVQMYWVEDSRLFSNIGAEVSSGYISELTRYDDFISRSFADREPWSTFELDGGELFVTGDTDGNGTRELVVSDGHDIRVYNMKKEMQEIWYIKGGTKERHLSVDMLDLNGNGREEIFITSLIDEERAGSIIGDDIASPVTDRGRLRSFVIEYDPAEGYRKISEGLPYFLRVTSGKLLMQGFRDSNIFDSPVYIGRWDGGTYQPDRPLELPDGVNIYGFVHVDWQKRGVPDIMSIDDRGFLNLYRKGEQVWRSDTTYGRPLISFKKETPSMIDLQNEWIIRGRLIAVNTDKGQQVIAVRRKELLTKVPRLGSFSAEVYTLKWDGGSMDEELMLRGVSGSLSDYWVDGKRLYLLARSGLFSLLTNSINGEFKRPSILYYYNFEDR
jgi:hypothetical protein